MKTITFISLLLSSQLFAGNLIFKNSFENEALVAGSSTGISSTGLILQLTSGVISENLSVNANGVFVFNSNIEIGKIWSVSIISLPNNPQPQICSLSNNSGTMSASGANSLQVSCDGGSLIWNQGNWDNADWE